MASPVGRTIQNVLDMAAVRARADLLAEISEMHQPVEDWSPGYVQGRGIVSELRAVACSCGLDSYEECPTANYLHQV